MCRSNNLIRYSKTACGRIVKESMERRAETAPHHHKEQIHQTFPAVAESSFVCRDRKTNQIITETVKTDRL
jgi:hypothetical protein